MWSLRDPGNSTALITNVIKLFKLAQLFWVIYRQRFWKKGRMWRYYRGCALITLKIMKIFLVISNTLDSWHHSMNLIPNLTKVDEFGHDQTWPKLPNLGLTKPVQGWWGWPKFHRACDGRINSVIKRVILRAFHGLPFDSLSFLGKIPSTIAKDKTFWPVLMG